MGWFSKKAICLESGCKNEQYFQRLCSGHYEAQSYKEQLSKSKPEVSEIDHILWLMDKFPINDFSYDSLRAILFTPGNNYIFFKKSLILEASNEDFNKFSEKYNEKIKIDIKEKRQKVLDQIADERIKFEDELPSKIRRAIDCVKELDKVKPVKVKRKTTKKAKK